MPNLHVHSFTRMKNVQTICSETLYTAFNTLLKIESIYGDFALQTAFSTLGDNVKKNIQGVPNTCDWKKKMINISHFESS